MLGHEVGVVELARDAVDLAAQLGQAARVGLLEPDLEVALLLDAAGTEAGRPKLTSVV